MQDRIRFCFFLMLLITGMSVPAQAQLTKAGGGLVFSPKTSYQDEPSGTLGLELTSIIELNLPVQLSPGFIYILPRTESFEFGGIKTKTYNSRFMLDVDAHYVFNALDRFGFYGIGGINLAFYRYTIKEEFVDQVIRSTHSNFYPGLNVGAGTFYRLNDQMDLMAAGKVVLGKALQFQIQAGVLMNLEWFASHDE